MAGYDGFRSIGPVMANITTTELMTTLWRGDLGTELPLIADSGNRRRSILPFLNRDFRLHVAGVGYFLLTRGNERLSPNSGRSVRPAGCTERPVVRSSIRGLNRSYGSFDCFIEGFTESSPLKFTRDRSESSCKSKMQVGVPIRLWLWFGNWWPPWW